MQLLRQLPVDTGFAFVFIQHLDSHPLTEFLSRETLMPLLEAADAMPVEPNHVYVVPSDANLAILHGVLYLMPRQEEHGQHLSIDYFFNSLARDKGNKAIGVILSGTASDGIFGLKAIKAEGGITFAQDEASAKYDGMPHGAIAAGCVDFAMPPENIAQELARIARHPYLAHAKTASFEPFSEGADDIGKVFILLRRHSGVDFTHYKRATIQRRIKRRMLLQRLENLQQYIKYLESNPAEVDALYDDLLINVTTFFRDPEAFAALKESAFPLIMTADRGDAPIRIWVTGCSTGEEVYSIAISLLEFLDDNAVPIQIFATDIDGQAIEKARLGCYRESIAENVSAERLRRFFVKTPTGYQIAKFIRDMCIFAKQNVFKDPPFSRLDLISCRNLLIYFGPDLQKKVFPIFHYALKPTGFLFLGSAETIGEFTDFFSIVDQKTKIYAKKSIATPQHFDFACSDGQIEHLPVVTEKTMPHQDIQKLVDQLLLDRFAPSGVVIDGGMEILQFRGKTGEFIEPAAGDASLNLLRMARAQLQMPLRAAIMTAIRGGVIVRKEVRGGLKDGGGSLVIEVIPVRDLEGVYLVLFEPIVGVPEETREEGSPEVDRLRQELAITWEYLQSVIEQQEVGNEELRSANEEIQSANEELQSINEELETAKEELQSVNEELSTVNGKLEVRNNELTLTNNDLINLFNSAGIPLVIVGPDLRIRRLSPMTNLLNFAPTDIGRSITEIRMASHSNEFRQIVMDAINSISYKEMEIRDHGGRWYSMRVRPYITADNKIEGAVIAFIDIDGIKRSLDIAQDSQDYAEAIVASVECPLLILDRDLRVVSASGAYYASFRVSQKDTVDNLLYRLGNGQWAIPRLRALLEGVLTQDKGFDDFRVTHDFEHIGEKTVSVSGRRIPPGMKRPALILMQIEMAEPMRDGDG